MFDKLVVSTAQRRGGRTAKFFLCTSLTYLTALAIAFALSVSLAEPKLADTSELRVLIPHLQLRAPIDSVQAGDSGSTPRPDLGRVMKYDDLVAHQQSAAPRVNLPTGAGLDSHDGFFNGDPNAIAGGIDVGPGGAGAMEK
jgi:hypothetical protein